MEDAKIYIIQLKIIFIVDCRLIRMVNLPKIEKNAKYYNISHHWRTLSHESVIYEINIFRTDLKTNICLGYDL